MIRSKWMTACVLAGLITAMSGAGAFSALAAGWTQEGSNWAYYDTDGSKHKGWIQTNDGYYYLDLSTGLMSIGWKQINNNWYYFKPDGFRIMGNGTLCWMTALWLKAGSGLERIISSSRVTVPWLPDGGIWTMPGIILKRTALWLLGGKT